MSYSRKAANLQQLNLKLTHYSASRDFKIMITVLKTVKTEVKTKTYSKAKGHDEW